MYSDYYRTPVVHPSYDATAPFANPFADVASTQMPLSVAAMLRYAEYFAVTNETLRESFNRIAAYFVTDIDVKGELGDDEKEDHKEYLKKQLRIVENLTESALSFLVYGNHYVSVFAPILRYVHCPRCKTQYKLSEVIDLPKFKFRWSDGYHLRCAACQYDGDFGPPHDDEDKSKPLIFRAWNPHDIRHEGYNESTGQVTTFRWMIPSDYRSEIKQGFNRTILCESPWTHIQAGLNDQDILFTDEQIHFWREPSLTGLRFRGVGVPRAMINFRQLYHTQILRRMNEVLALGHVVPMRVISPAPTVGRAGEEGDILKTTYMGDLRGRVNQIIANHRADPNSVHFSPIALQMQALGADARQLIPADILNQANEILLNGSGVPVEFYRMSMQTQTAPVGLRLIERYWSPLVGGLNRLLEFVARRCQLLLSWEKATYELATVRLVDSIELNQLRVQMAQAGLLSRSTAVETVDANFREETRKKLEDMNIEQVEQANFQRKSDAFAFSRQLAEAMPMGPLAGGQPAQPGANGQPAQGDPSQAGTAPGIPPGSDPLAGIVPQEGARVDPQELTSRAQAAAQVLIQMPESQRYGKLQEIRKANELFHKLVKGEMEKMRSKARSQGAQLILSGQAGQNGQPQQ